MGNQHPCVTGRVRRYKTLENDRRLWGWWVLLEIVENDSKGIPDRVRIKMATKDEAAIYNGLGNLDSAIMNK